MFIQIYTHIEGVFFLLLLFTKWNHPLPTLLQAAFFSPSLEIFHFGNMHIYSLEFPLLVPVLGRRAFGKKSCPPKSVDLQEEI